MLPEHGCRAPLEYVIGHIVTTANFVNIPAILLVWVITAPLDCWHQGKRAFQQRHGGNQKDMFWGMIGSLPFGAALFVGVSVVLCGMVNYKELHVDASVVYALEKVAGNDLKRLRMAVEVAVLAGLSSVILVLLLGQPRIFFSMARDGLLPPVFAKVHLL